MSANTFISVGTLVNSCLIGANAYRVTSREEDFETAPVEEMTDSIRQRPGHCHMCACTALDKTELWMVPFAAGQKELLRLQEAMEHIQRACMGRPRFHFPFDVVEEDGKTAYLMRPIQREGSTPVRKFLPDALAERWKLAVSIFRRVRELHGMGLTSNGISREQLRVDEKTWEAELWLNQTVRLLGADRSGPRHEGFCTIPVFTEKKCAGLGKVISSDKRDVFSAAVLAFYLIEYTHPFVGSGFNGLLREDYLTHYLHAPAYVMDPKGSNGLGNQLFAREVEEQWKKTVPELKRLFDGIFMAVTDPELLWDPTDPWWDPQVWIKALEADAAVNDNESSHSAYHFTNDRYHQV